MTALYFDFHILQDVPPSNINRDDTGTPKTAIYGGVDRLRVSSQAWKRATRLEFAATQAPVSLGVRTRRFVALVAEELGAVGVEPGLAETLATAAAGRLGIKAGKKDTDLAYLLFFGRNQLAEITTALQERADAAQGHSAEEVAKIIEDIDVKEILGRGHSLDVALFGRMVADVADLNVDAATQVAHAISTHPAPTQYDYFTAVDDQQSDSETGAGMIGMVEFNSATLYRYATVGVHQLIENLGDAESAVKGVVEFAKAFSLSMPSGHQTSFAARTRPGLVLVVARRDQPVSLVSAFEAPIRGGAKGTFDPSLEALARFYSEETVRWGDEPSLVAASYRGRNADVASAFGPSLSEAELLQSIRAAAEAWVGNRE